MAPASALGLDLVSAVAIGAAGVVASAALYAFSGTGKKEKTVEPPQAKQAQPKTLTSSDSIASVESDGETKLSKKQRQKMNKQKKREEEMALAQSQAVAASTDSDGTQSPPSEEKKKKKKSKKSKSKKVEQVESGKEEAALSGQAQSQEVQDEQDQMDDDGELKFALAMAGNQKNMQAMRNDQQRKAQKEAEKLQRKKTADEREKREKDKAEEAARAKLEAEAAADANTPKQETTIIAIKPIEVQIILGGGGKVIKQIRAESGARLDVSKREDDANNKDRRLLTIVGTPEQIDNARRLLRAVFKEESAKSEVVDVGDKMAAVIGKGGSVIKRIKEETGATLDADRETGTIRVSGEPEQIEQAVIQIKKISAPGDQISMKINKRQKMLVIGKGGLMIRKIEDMTSCQLDVEKTEDGGGILKIGGDSTQVLEAMKSVQKLFVEASFTVTVACGDLIGAVIGKGGDVIRKIQEDTQVKLDVDMEKKCVVIIGYEKDVMRAKERIESILACPVEVKAGEMKVHVDLAGYVSSVIGRGGSKVREIEESSGATVKVLGTDCIIVGKKKNVESAKHRIDEIVKKQVDANVRTEAAMKAVQALSESHTQNSVHQEGKIPWGCSAWGQDLQHWTPAPVQTAIR